MKTIRFATLVLVCAYALIAVSWLYIFFGRHVFQKNLVEVTALLAAFGFIFAHQAAAVLFAASACISGISLYRDAPSRTPVGVGVFVVSLSSAFALGGVLIWGFVAEEIRASRRAKRPNQAMQLTASKLAIYAPGGSHRASGLRASRSGLAAADLVSR